MKTLARRHPLVLGTVAAVVALVLAAGAAVGVGAITDDDEATPPVDASLRITEEDMANEPNPLVARDAAGEPAPTTPFPKLGGGLASLADYEGTPVVLNFFGSWCVPCREEMPDLQRVHEELGDRVTFLGIAVRDSERDAAEFAERFGVTYDLGRDASGKLATELGVVNMPSTFFIGADGTIVGARPGAVDAEVLRRLIDDHLLS